MLRMNPKRFTAQSFHLEDSGQQGMHRDQWGDRTRCILGSMLTAVRTTEDITSRNMAGRQQIRSPLFPNQSPKLWTRSQPNLRKSLVFLTTMVRKMKIKCRIKTVKTPRVSSWRKRRHFSITSENQTKKLFQSKC